MRTTILCSALAVGVFLFSPAHAVEGAESSSLLRWLTTPEPGFSAELFRSVAGNGLQLTQGQPIHVYFRMLPVVELIDGGPNIDGADRGSNTYEEAFWPAYGMNLEWWVRAVPNVYATVSMGGVVFPGGNEMDTIDGYRYKLDDLYPATLSIGGAFAAPLAYLFDSQESPDDLEGLLGTFAVEIGMRYMPAVDMTITHSPTTPGSVNLTGRESDYWKSRVGFHGAVHLGLEWRLGPLSLIVDAGIRTFGKPSAATQPPWWSAGQAMLTYPLRAGISIRF